MLMLMLGIACMDNCAICIRLKAKAVDVMKHTTMPRYAVPWILPVRREGMIWKNSEITVPARVSQKTQKSEFWNVTYPSGFHRLDEPPEKISAL